MLFSVLGSGSKGNSVYIEEGRTAILIDNGFSGKDVITSYSIHYTKLYEYLRLRRV